MQTKDVRVAAAGSGGRKRDLRSRQAAFLSGSAAGRGLRWAFAVMGVVLWAAFMVDGWLLVPSVILGAMLLTLAMIDVERFQLPDALTYPLLLLGLAAALSIDPARFADHLIGALAGFVSFAGMREVYFRLRGREGIGLGDAKLMAALGMWLSWDGLPSVVLLASVAALVVTLAHAFAGRSVAWDQRVPFGAYLALGGWMTWLYGPLVFQ